MLKAIPNIFRSAALGVAGGVAPGDLIASRQWHNNIPLAVSRQS